MGGEGTWEAIQGLKIVLKGVGGSVIFVVKDLGDVTVSRRYSTSRHIHSFIVSQSSIVSHSSIVSQSNEGKVATFLIRDPPPSLHLTLMECRGLCSRLHPLTPHEGLEGERLLRPRSDPHPCLTPAGLGQGGRSHPQQCSITLSPPPLHHLI